MTDERRSTRTTDFVFDGKVVRATFHQGAEVTLPDAEQHAATVEALCGGRKVAVLVDLRQLKSQDRETRAFYASARSVAFTKCCALLINSSLSKVLGSFFMGFNKPPYPTRLFTSPEEAEAWLATFDVSDRA